MSGLGKGITAASVGRILKNRGYRVTAVKIDPYLNIDAGTMNPAQHGEVFVLKDGSEVDLDLGNYERFLDIELTASHNITTGKVYRTVIDKERRGDFLGETVQIIPHYGQKPVGILATNVEDIGKHVDNVPIVGLTEHWETFIKKLQPDQVVLLDESFSREKITDLVAACEDAFIDFKMGADIYGLIASNVGVEYVSHIPLLGFRSLPLDDPWNQFMKRVFDIFVAGIMTLVFLPLGLVVAVLIKLEGKGPVFYFQERVGRDGKVFRLIKFRTMKIDAEKETGPVWAKPQDDRKTQIGETLRRWNLDELPQLLNVLSGKMSLVGPRPERPHFVDKFRENVPRYMARHKVKSGLTGWAQVHGLRGDTSIEERIKYDLYYMENWSLLLDIEILVMTLFAFKNAY